MPQTLHINGVSVPTIEVFPGTPIGTFTVIALLKKLVEVADLDSDSCDLISNIAKILLHPSTQSQWMDNPKYKDLNDASKKQVLEKLKVTTGKELTERVIRYTFYFDREELKQALEKDLSNGVLIFVYDEETEDTTEEEFLATYVECVLTYIHTLQDLYRETCKELFLDFNEKNLITLSVVPSV